MRRNIALLSVTLIAAMPARGEGLAERLQQGIGQAAEGGERGIGQGAAILERGAERLGETVDSTLELATNEPTPEATRSKIDTMADEVLTRLFDTEPGARVLLDTSAGYAVFDTRETILAGLAAGFGRGVAVDRATGTRTYMNMGTGGIGLSFGLGGVVRQVVILFERPDDFARFVSIGLDATAETGAMLGEQVQNDTLRFEEGRRVFVLADSGLKLSGALTGTRYWQAPTLNDDEGSRAAPGSPISEAQPGASR
jgi:hypothetical protein